jgi:predicted ribosome quality control (RQC) complex YloA/Tae2 family protein
MPVMTTTDKFSELEARIIRTIDLVKTTRREKDAVDKELLLARKNIARLEDEIEELKRERDLVKNKVESLLENLTELTEGPIA